MPSLVRVHEDGRVEYPYSLEQLRRQRPDLSIGRGTPGELKALGRAVPPVKIFTVTDVNPPAINPATQRLNPVGPELVDGQWRQVWTTRPATAAEMKDERLPGFPSPDYQAFYLGLHASAFKREVLDPLVDQGQGQIIGFLAIEVGLALLDAGYGMVPLPTAGYPPNRVQSALWRFTAAAAPSMRGSDRKEIESLMESTRMDDFYRLDQLSPKVPGAPSGATQGRKGTAA